ncbi:MAG: hypothetical protein U5K56_13400 [Halioglobus sp.]|nr:hypothetical protein [Halioglobus sp.]
MAATTRLTPEGSAEDVRELTLELPARREDARRADVAVQPSRGPCKREPAAHQGRRGTCTTSVSIPSRTAPEYVAPDRTRVKICVKRCSYIDQYSGESWPGIASNYLCDLDPGDQLTVNGPFGQPWELPADTSADLLLIGMGTGVAPFRALVRHVVC